MQVGPVADCRRVLRQEVVVNVVRICINIVVDEIYYEIDIVIVLLLMDAWQLVCRAA